VNNNGIWLKVRFLRGGDSSNFTTAEVILFCVFDDSQSVRVVVAAVVKCEEASSLNSAKRSQMFKTITESNPRESG
jgi:hypothetical protein